MLCKLSVLCKLQEMLRVYFTGMVVLKILEYYLEYYWKKSQESYIFIQKYKIWIWI